MCQTAINNLRVLLEFEQQGKTDIDACLSNHKEKFSDLFEKQAEENRQSVQQAIETKTKFAQQTKKLENELRMNFNTFETDQSRIYDLVSSILKIGKCVWRYSNYFLSSWHRSMAKRLLLHHFVKICQQNWPQTQSRVLKRCKIVVKPLMMRPPKMTHS